MRLKGLTFLNVSFTLLRLVLMFALSVRCYASEHSDLKNSNRKLPECLQELLTANSFDDGIRGESPELRKNYATYLSAAGMIPNLLSKDLAYVRDHGTPAGRVYAAILLKQSGQSDSVSFEQLLGDKSTVTYFSGCKGTTATVGDIARNFIEKGRYFNFSLKNFCTFAPGPKTPAEVQAVCLASLMSQTTVQHFEQGDSNQPSDAWRAFHLLLRQGVQAKPAALSLLGSQHSGARIYGAVLLRQFDEPEGTRRLGSMLKDNSTVVYANGCEQEESSVGALSGRLLKGEELVKLTDPRVKNE